MRFDASKFTWDKNRGTACASDLGYRAGQIPGGQIYPDAADFGLIVNGKKESLIFILKQRAASGWHYDAMRQSDGAVFTLFIFND